MHKSRGQGCLTRTSRALSDRLGHAGQPTLAKKSLTEQIWTCGEPNNKFKGPDVHFESRWTYLTQRDKSMGLQCILLFINF